MGLVQAASLQQTVVLVIMTPLNGNQQLAPVLTVDKNGVGIARGLFLKGRDYRNRGDYLQPPVIPMQELKTPRC